MKKTCTFALLTCCLLGFVLLLTGCRQPEERIPKVIAITSGDAQYGRPGDETANPLTVQVLGVERTISGGRKRLPAREVRVRIEPMSPESGALAVSPEGVTDNFGIFRTRLRFGKVMGDQTFKVTCPDYDDVPPQYFRISSGLDIRGNTQQAFAGDMLPEPIQIVLGTEEAPAVGVPVYFTLLTGPPNASLTQERVLTNSRGVASTQLQTAQGYTGSYEIFAEIGEDANKDATGSFRGVTIQALALSRTDLLISVLSGLALFIYGMTLMSDGLQSIVGSRLKGVLQMFTGNRISAVLAGMGVTALIQSSGACTVMVVGFVNAGLMNLSQAIGVIFGSAIGTTVTAQMVSFKLDSLALPAIALGVLVLLISRKSRMRGLANTILGFGVLFFGMTMMSSELKVISEFPSFKAIFSYFDCAPRTEGGFLPFLPVCGAVLFGMVMTVVVQSSSATVGLAIAMAQSGLLNFYTAVPLILGDNIGSTLTGVLATINTNRTSRQAALAATIFKTLAVIVMLALLYVQIDGKPCFLVAVNALTSGDVFAPQPENIGRHLANAHTIFNIVAVLAFIPLINTVAAIAKFLVRDNRGDNEDNDKICHLEPHLLNSPSAALNEVLTALLSMTRAAIVLSRQSIEAFMTKDNSHADDIYHQEKLIDTAQKDIIDYLVKLTRRSLSEEQSLTIPDFMHCVNDVERIGDRAINIFSLIEGIEANSLNFTEASLKEIGEIKERLVIAGEMMIDGLLRNDISVIDKVIKHCGEISQMTSVSELNHEIRLHNRDCSVENGLVYVELLGNLERISAHIENLAERASAMLKHKVLFKS